MRPWEDNIRKVVPYVPGEQPKKKSMIKLNTNENPYPPAPGVEAAMKSLDTDRFRLYPDPAADVLVAALAERYGLEKNQVFVGVGSDDVLAMAFLTFFNSDKPVLFPDISYSFYSVWADLYRIPYERPALDEAFCIRKEDYYKENGGVIFPNPNAPTSLAMGLSDVEDIIAHNRQDILSLGLMLDKLLQVYAAPEKQTSVQDLFSLGKVLERQGESAGARALYRLSAAPRRAISLASLREKAVAGQANMRLARLSLRNGDVEEARETLERMLRRGQMGAWPHVELAKIYEHRIRDLMGALEHTRQALALAPPEERPALEKREARLLDKIEKQRKETMQ